MEILYIGKFYPQNILKTLKEDSRNKAGGMSNHNFEMSIVNGLCHHKDILLQCLTIPEVYSFPYNNKKFYTKAESYEYNSTHIDSVGFCNLPIVKGFWSTISLAVKILRKVRRSKEHRIDIIVNTPDYNLLSAVRIAKALSVKKVTYTVVIPDIPSMLVSMNKPHPLKELILKYINSSSMKMTSRSNGLVLLTECMMDFVSNKAMPHIVMEGIVDVETMAFNDEKTEFNKEVILYTGTLLKIFGVRNLVQAFQRIDNDRIELWICGAGDSKEYIEQAASEDRRIKFYGLVDSQKALQLQQLATILVNPRTSEGEYTKYSFPSKTMEYLLAGKSVIINRLQGIPEEYYNYVYTPADESVDALSACITDVINADICDRKRRANGGRGYVITKKNSKCQTSRIIDLIRKY